MGYLNKKASSVYITEESIEGTVVMPSAGSQAVGVLMDGLEINGEKELVERNLLTNTIAKQTPLTSIKTSSGSIAVEASANKTAGSAPEYGLLMKSLLGGVRTLADTIAVTGGTVAVVEVASSTGLAVGDIIMIKKGVGGACHISPITSLTATEITLAIPAAVAFVAGDSIEKAVNYYGVNSGHPSLSITQYMDDKIRIQASGVKVASMSVDSFAVGQLPSFNFSFNGLGYSEAVASAPAGAKPAVFVSAQPPLILNACVYMDDGTLIAQDVALSISNGLGRITSTCSANGVIGQLITQREITGSFTSYMSDSDVNMFTKFDANSTFRLFFYATNPVNGVAGGKKEAFAVHVPHCIITSIAKADSDGIMTLSVSFSAGEPVSGSDINVAFM
jgi:hypothetical protein